MSEDGDKEASARVVGLDSEDADTLLSALSSETARDILVKLDGDSMTASELAEERGSSLQNTRYHLQKLQDAELVEVVDMKYSPKGREMDVYQSSGKPLVIFSGEGEEATESREILKRLAGAFLALGAASIFVDYLTRRLKPTTDYSRTNARNQTEDVSSAATQEAAGDGGGTETGRIPVSEGAGGNQSPAGNTSSDFAIQNQSQPQQPVQRNEQFRQSLENTTAQSQTFDNATQSLDAEQAARPVFEAVPPGLLFFLGGALVLVILTLWIYVRRDV